MAFSAIAADIELYTKTLSKYEDACMLIGKTLTRAVKWMANTFMSYDYDLRNFLIIFMWIKVIVLYVVAKSIYLGAAYLAQWLISAWYITMI